MLAWKRDAGRHRMTAEAAEQTGMTSCNGIEHVANMQPRHRARRAFQLCLGSERKGDHRTMDLILDARSDEPDDALVPGLIEQTQPARQSRAVEVKRLHECHRLLLHVRFD